MPAGRFGNQWGRLGNFISSASDGKSSPRNIAGHTRPFSSPSLPRSHLSPGPNLHPSFAEVTRSGAQASTSSFEVRALLDKISLLEEEISLVKAHLRLESSLSEALLRSEASDTVPSLTACRNSRRSQSRLIDNNRVVPNVRPFNANNSKVSEPDFIIKDEVSPVRYFDLYVEEQSGCHNLAVRQGAHSILANCFDFLPFTCCSDNLAQSLSEQCDLLATEASPVVDSAIADHDNGSVNLVADDIGSLDAHPSTDKGCNSIIGKIGASTIYWHDGEGTFVHPASGMRYFPENDTFYSFISDDLDDNRVLFYNTEKGSFVLTREGSIGKGNE